MHLFLFIFLLFSRLAFAQAPLTLKSCYELALKRSEQTAIEEENIRGAEAKYAQVRGAILPRISFQGSELLQDTSGVADTTSTVSSTLTRFSKPELKFNAKQPLFSGFRDFHGLAVARAQKRENSALFEEAKRLLFLDVAKAFYSTIQLQKDVMIVEDMTKTLKDRLSEAEKRKKLGKARASEKVSTEAELATEEALLSQLEGAYQNAKEVLTFFTGEPSENLIDNIEVSDTSGSVSPRPDIIAAQESFNAAKQNLSFEKGALFPTINAEANYYTHRVGFQENIQWDALFTLDVPLFRGGQTRGKIQEAKINLKQEALRLSAKKRQSELEIKQASEDFATSQKQLAAYQKAEAKASENYRLYSKDFGLGVIDNLDLLQALKNWQEARRNRQRTELTTKLNYLSLKVAKGESVP